ncbi:MAG: hypothetical protein RLZZ568_1560 [Cyanobacteriota bacterium]|jgi:uncharacterized membrane protein YdjX (TVP38/TMEM64 family)
MLPCLPIDQGQLLHLLTPIGVQPVPLAMGLNPQQLLQEILAWIEGLGPAAAIAFIGFYALATVALLPGSVLTIGGGVLFGVVWGSIYVFVGATLGATGAFLVGRYLARDWVERKIAQYPKFQAIDRAVKQDGLKITLLTRLSPLFPFVLLNYAYGITGVSLSDYLWGCAGMIPGTILYVYLGSLAGDLASLAPETQTGQGWLLWGGRLIGFAATIGVTIYLTHIARQALATEIERDS